MVERPERTSRSEIFRVDKVLPDGTIVPKALKPHPYLTHRPHPILIIENKIQDFEAQDK
jgi:hypothetical protein